MMLRTIRERQCSLLLTGLLVPTFATAVLAAQVIDEGCAVIHEMTGEAAGDQFGWVSNCIEDVNDDGIKDMIITAPTNDANGNASGRVYVHSGATGEELYRMTGGAAGWRFGSDAADAGDLNDDGIHDVIVGAPGTGTGRARVFSGVDGSLIHSFVGEVSGDQFGARVWGNGDVNGDKVSDVIIGAPFHDAAGLNAGRAYVYSGADFSLICTIDGDAANDRLGIGVAFVGDISNPPDGRLDVVVGAMNAGGGGGLAYVYSFDDVSCNRQYTLDPGPVSTNFGQWFMNGGYDVNGDEIPDIYVNDFPANLAHVFSGLDGDKIWTLNGEGEGGGFGIGRLVPDVTGDDRADLILAAWASGVGAPGAGKAFVYSGATGEVVHTYTHNISGANFGFDANGMGDVDGDGSFDYLVTAASDLSGRGVSYVITGNAPAPLLGDVDSDCDVDFTDILKLLNEWGPCALAPAGCRADFNGDGVVDFADLLIILANWT